MRAALIVRDGMNFVDYQGAHRSQHFARPRRSQQNVQRFRRGHQNVGRVLAHPLALPSGCVAGANSGPDLPQRDVIGACDGRDSGQRNLQILMNIVTQGLERRHIQHLGLIGKLTQAGAAHQVIDRAQERRQRFAGSRRRGNQNIMSGLYFPPSLALRLRDGGKIGLKPFADERIERSEWHGNYPTAVPRACFVPVISIILE